MNDLIIVALKPTEAKQYVYIFSELCEEMPIILECGIDQLMSTITMSAAKYKIKKIKLSGPKTFSLGVKDQLSEKIKTCFGKTDGFTIELM